MKSLVAGLAFALTVAATATFAQPVVFPANEMGVANGHVHLNSKDEEALKKIFTTMGGRIVKLAGRDVALFPGVVIFLNRRGLRGGSGGGATGGSVGSVINHIGFSVRDLKGQVAKWKAAGIPIEDGVGRPERVYVNTPDGLRIEVVEDTEQSWPIRNEHLHFEVLASEASKLQAWYVNHFGGYAATRGNAPIVELPGVRLRIAVVDKAQAPTADRAIDHIGFEVKNLAQFIKNFRAEGIQVDPPFNEDATGAATSAFVTDPWGTIIELNERKVPIQ